MRHWLLRAILVLGVILGISIPSFSTTVSILNRIDPIAPIVSRKQKSGPQPLSLPPASRLASLSGIAHAIRRRDGIHIQELGSDLRLYYHVFRVSNPMRSLWDKTSLMEGSGSICSLSFPYQKRCALNMTFSDIRPVLVRGVQSRRLLVSTRNGALRRSGRPLPRKGYTFQLGDVEAGAV